MEYSGSEIYKNPLPKGKTLRIYNGQDLIFESEGKWLNPLFELEDFLKDFPGKKDDLRAHDTAIGKAAAVLMVRMNIHFIQADLISDLALDWISSLNQKNQNVQVCYTNKVHRLLCATEEQLSELSDSDQMYFLLRQRAKRILGLSVVLQNVCHKFLKIKNLSFELAPGGRLMIQGENGSGKTTLLRMIAGIYKPDSGKILIDGKNPAENPKYTIGYIPQNTENSDVSLTVYEVVSLGITEYKNQKEKNQIILKNLERTGCAHLKDRSFSTLSGGEKQKVQMARCLAQNAKILLLDEPTAALDGENRKMVIEILRSLSLTEIPTIITVTHDKALCQNLNWPLLDFDKTGGE